MSVWLKPGERVACLRNCSDLQCRSIEQSASDGRNDMQDLNDRLATYLKRVRQQQMNPAAYQEAIQGLENELTNMKRCYDSEINRLRCLLEGAVDQKACLTSRVEQLTMTNNENQGRLSDEMARSQALSQDLECMRMLCAQAQKEIADLRNAMTDCANLRPTLDRLQRENEELRCKLECEMALRLRALEEEKLKNNQLQFDARARDQLVQDLENRLRAAGDIIVGLEARINQLTQSENNDVGNLIKKIREGTAAELQRYQQETEAALNRSLNTLRCQIDDLTRTKDTLECQKADLENQVRQQASTIADLEAQLNALVQKCRALEEALATERLRAEETIRELERQLKELMCSAMCKEQECSAARDAHLSLKSEIETYKSVMENEERQLPHEIIPPKPRYSVARVCGRKTFTPAPACPGQYGPSMNCYTYRSLASEARSGYGDNANSVPRKALSSCWLSNQQTNTRLPTKVNPCESISHSPRKVLPACWIPNKQASSCIAGAVNPCDTFNGPPRKAKSGSRMPQSNQQSNSRICINTNPYQSTSYKGRSRSGVASAFC